MKQLIIARSRGDSAGLSKKMSALNPNRIMFGSPAGTSKELIDCMIL
jgi:hypothetical protein